MPLGEVVELPLVGLVGGGYGEEEFLTPQMEMVPIPAAFLEGSKAENCRLRRVTGESMTCADVKRTIPEGATVIYDKSLTPMTGDIILCRLWIGDVPNVILKIWDSSKPWVELRSYNESAPPIVLTEDMKCELLGVYLNHLGVGRRERRRL